MRQLSTLGGCTRPVRLAGHRSEHTLNTTTGEIGPARRRLASADLPAGDLLVRCGNRRTTRCAACAETYRRDTYHLITAGLRGGKGTPEQVTTHPRVFATFTAPSFGPVHNRPSNRPTCACGPGLTCSASGATSPPKPAATPPPWARSVPPRPMAPPPSRHPTRRRSPPCGHLGRDDYAAYVLVLVLGLRKGEVLGLTWSDVNLDVGELRVSHQLQRVRRQLLHSDVAKAEASEAVLPLPEVCVAALRARQKAQQAAKAAAKELWTGSDFVFTTRYGTPIEPRNFTREFNRRCDRAGVRIIRVHDTRHTCASLLAAMDVHPRIAMQILRHSEIAVTMEVYTHVPSEETRRALRKLGKALGGGRTPEEPEEPGEEDGQRQS